MVGFFDQILRQVFRAECRNTTTERESYPKAAIDGNFDLIELSTNPIENNAGLLSIGIRQNYGEFVATDAAQNIFLAQIDTEELRKEFEHLVATTVPDFVVNLLE